jgi:hypothetical protein
MKKEAWSVIESAKDLAEVAIGLQFQSHKFLFLLKELTDDGDATTKAMVIIMQSASGDE